MNAKLFLLCLFPTAMAFAQDSAVQINSTSLPPVHWNTDAAHWDKWITERRSSAVVALGKSDFVLSGPIIEGFRPLHKSENLSIGQKILRLPVIRLLVPRPMESPPETGKYFAWRGESNRPWTAIAEGGSAGGGPTDNFMNHRPQTSLISLGK
jgi:hypothetical protein